MSARKAQAVLAVARGEAEAEWVEHARSETVRALEAAVRAADRAGDEDEDEDEDWERIRRTLAPETRERLDEAMALAGKLFGAGAPKWQQLEAICQEFLGAHPVEPTDEENFPRAPVSDWLESAKVALEEETARWNALGEVEPVEAPRLDDGHDDVHRLDAQLRQLAAMRDRWDELVGHLAMLVRMLGLWRDMGFASLSHYCSERLGMAARTVEQRASLERRLYALPMLRRAMREGRISYEAIQVLTWAPEHWVAPADGHAL